jgi:hypothetical protein
MYVRLGGPGKDFRVSASDHLTHYLQCPVSLTRRWKSGDIGRARCSVVNTDRLVAVSVLQVSPRDQPLMHWNEERVIADVILPDRSRFNTFLRLYIT